MPRHPPLSASLPSHVCFSLPSEAVHRGSMTTVILTVQQRSKALQDRLAECMQEERSRFDGGVKIHNSLLNDSKARAAERGALSVAIRRNAAIEQALQTLQSIPPEVLKAAIKYTSLTEGNVESLALRLKAKQRQRQCR